MNATDREALKRKAAEKALEHVVEGEVLGVGTGSTVNHFIELLAERRLDLPGAVASSEATAARLKAVGIPVVDLNQAGTLEVYVDGADEADPHRRLIKGGGGALTREKIVAEASRRFVCIVDASKRVDVLGDFGVPVEVLPMARSLVARKLAAMGGRPVWREGVITDNGGEIIDLHGLRILDPLDLETRIEIIPGVISCGLFARRGADVLITAAADGLRVEPAE